MSWVLSFILADKGLNEQVEQNSWFFSVCQIVLNNELC